MNLKGTSVVEDVAVADYFAYRNITIDENNYTQYLSEVTFTNRSATRTGWVLYLDGSLGGDMGAFVTIDDLADDIDNYPIIGIIPPSQNTPGTAPPTSGAGSGHRIIIEAKGRFLTKDRKKHRLIKEQFGDKYDIRFVFSNSKGKIGSKSKTTYALWCEKLGFKYCDCEIPTAWIKE